MRLVTSRKTYLSLRPTLIQGEPVRLAVGVSVMVPLGEARAGLFDEKEVAAAILAGAPPDEGFAKEAGEFLLAGSAFAIGGAKDAVQVKTRVGRLDKTLLVVGDRRWTRGGVSDPTPFTEMPLDWAHAFGGPNHRPNPLGKGFAPNEDGSHPLPNIELPGRPVRSPSDRPAPAGFGAIEMMWPERHKKLGTYGDEWLKHGFPGFAKDLDRSYFNVAPADQQLGPGEYWRGDEEIVLENLHPERPTLTARLPSLRARVFIHQRTAASPAMFAEVPTRLETIMLLPNAERAILIFRGTQLVKEDDGDDVVRMMLAIEGVEAERPIEHYQEAFSRRLDRTKRKSLVETDLRPEWTDRKSAETSAEEELLRKEDLLRKNLGRALELQFEKTRETIRSQGLDPDVHCPLPKRDAQVEHEDQAEEAIETEVGAADGSAEIAAMKAEVERRMEATTAEIKKLCGERGLDFEAMAAKGKDETGGPPKFRAEAVREQLRQMAELIRNAGFADDENRALISLADAELDRRLDALERKTLDGYRAYAHLLPPAALLEGAESDTLRERIAAEMTGAKNLAGWDLTGADLAGVDLAGADLRQALLEKTYLRSAILRGANLEGAVLARADLEDAVTSGARLAGSNLSGARLWRVDLRGADLRGAVLLGAELTGADLRGADLSDVDLTDTNLSRAKLAGAKLGGARLSAVRLDGAELREIDLSDATLRGVDLGGLDLAGSVLLRTAFVDCTGDRASFEGAKMINARFAKLERRCSFEGARFAKANLSHASLRDLELAGADFSSAILDDADLSGSNAEGARFTRASAKASVWIRTNLKGADLSSANLMGAMLKNANLGGARLRRANLFATNLFRVRVDGGTDIKDAELAQAMFVEDRS